jgi:hypothetical protein
MKYICLIALLFAIVYSQDCSQGMTGIEACQNITAKNATQRCCWVSGTVKTENFTFDNCSLFSMNETEYKNHFEELKKDIDGLKVECSSKYLYVVSLFALVF